MSYFYYNNRRIAYKRCNSLTNKDIFKRILDRIYSINFGNEEYLDSGFKLAKGITIKLIDRKERIEDDVNFDVRVDRDNKIIEFIRNKKGIDDLCWYSLISGNIEVQEKIKKAIDDLLS